MTNGIWQSATYKIVQRMKAAGNGEGLLEQWKNEVEAWAKIHPTDRDAKALLAWLPLWQIRDFYTAGELAPILPALAVTFGYRSFLRAPRSAIRVENRLRFVGLPVLQNADGCDTFVNPATGRYDRYFIVAKIGRWKQRPISQEEFEHVLTGSAQR